MNTYVPLDEMYLIAFDITNQNQNLVLFTDREDFYSLFVSFLFATLKMALTGCSCNYLLHQ